MKHNVKRTLSLLLALALALSLLPTVSLPVSALHYEENSGMCKCLIEDNVILSDNTKGTKMTVEAGPYGGTMYNYTYTADNPTSDAPWAAYIPVIEELELKDGVKNFSANGMSYFEPSDTKLKKVIFADSVEEIGWRSFYGNNSHSTSLEVEWGSGIKQVRQLAFCGSGVTAVTLPAIELIEEEAFLCCDNLQSVYLASDGLTMGDTAFSSCTKLKEVTMVGNVPTVSRSAFFQCGSLESIMLPASVTSVEKNAFLACNKLSTVYYGGTQAQWNAIQIAEGNECLTNATILFNRTPYVVSFDANGGWVSLESLTTAANGRLPSLPTPIRDGYSFVGWFTAPEGGSSVSTNTVFNTNTTIYAHWFEIIDSTCAVTVNPPMADCHPATTGRSADPSRYKVTGVSFCPLYGNMEGEALTADDTFAQNQLYRVHVRLTGTGDFVLTDDTPATINGIPAESEGVSMGGDAWYYVDMTASEAPVCELTVTPSMPGQHPVLSGESGDPSLFTVASVQYIPIKNDGGLGTALNETDVFTPNQVYRVMLVLWPVGGWEFTKDTRVIVNGMDAEYLLALNGNGLYSVDMACENPFVDVHESDFFFNPVMWAVGHTVTGGVDETHFAPERTVMRADSMVFFWAANDRPEFTATDKTFKDVKETHWAYKAVMWAVENGITGGTNTEGTKFSPKRTCSRSEILQFLYAAMGKPEISIENPYSDVKEKHWYYEGAIWAYEKGLEKGEGGRFNAATPCTRAYVVTYLYRYFTGSELAE